MSLIALNPSDFGMHSLRRTKASLVNKRAGSLRACQLLLGHTKLELTVSYPGIEAVDVLSLSEQPKI
jgi:site-specific recombinase XerC